MSTAQKAYSTSASSWVVDFSATLTPEEDLFTSVSKVRKVEFEATTLPLLFGSGLHFCLHCSEVVGSNHPTQSTSFNLVKYGIGLSLFFDNRRTKLLSMPMNSKDNLVRIS
jgi:hypothetical protein